MPHPIPANNLQRQAVLSKAVVRSADHLEIPGSLLARIIGISPASASRLRAETYLLSESRKEWELAVLLVRLFRSLDAIAGGSRQTAREWMQADNRALGGKKPIELITTAQGLVNVVTYLDAQRGIV
ncbi:antitoxin Xre/MbcA/ParS toxin-binding domain-containing protein [Chlorobium sp. N1]|uniref:antitoxin Xre/MbcA/ParS toxin-binding domain-containing protein n=1 Tax=Chlorobium sp. N1 TaxID=2491138 RepID=UPI0010391466|nr:antitoxin Xre/MbcA/ParS toxin-binding domain-containing protein [Chlorobium sp. N1]TCD47982.1 DUF2384 domain-containing protein [Chlorobium sp. N1]